MELCNDLAHFQGEISSDQRDQLRFCADWLGQCQSAFEESIEVNFTRVDPVSLPEHLTKIFVEKLEIAQSFEMQLDAHGAEVKFQKSAFKNVPDGLGEFGSIGSMVASAVACVLAKTTGKVVIIEKQLATENGKNLSINYCLYSEGENIPRSLFL